MKGKAQDSREKHLSCRSCGHIFTLFPPDDSFKDVYLTPCSDNDSDPNHNYRQIYQYDSCHDRTEYYWCPGNFFVA